MATFGAKYTAKVEFAKKPNRQAFWKEINKAMRKQGQEYKTMYSSWTSTWQSKPRYKVKITSQTKQGRMTGTVTPTADEGLLQIMNWVIWGTGSYVGRGYYPIRPLGLAISPGLSLGVGNITASGNYPLRYRKTYTPATQPGIIQSGKASYSGPQVTAMEVWHPGIKPRDIINFILLRRQAAYINAMGEAVKRGVAASIKAGRANV